MNALVRTLLAASIVTTLASPTRATDTAPIVALGDELNRRYLAGDYGRNEAFGVTVLESAGGEFSSLDGGDPKFGPSTSTSILRALPGRLRRMYPAEFRPDTPGDVSDLVDAFMPSAADAWRDFLDTRLAGLDALVVLAEQCGHRGNPAGVARLRALVARTRRKMANADAASPRARFDKMLRISVISAGFADVLGLAPTGLSEYAVLSARFGTRALQAVDSVTLEAGSLVVHADFQDVRLSAPDVQRVTEYVVDLRVDGVAAPGTFAPASGSMTIYRLTCDFDGNCEDSGQGRAYALVAGSVVVADLCDDRIEGTFTLKFRDPDNGSVFQVRSGTFNAPIH